MSHEVSITARSQAIRQAALRLGFDLVGITPAVTPGGFTHLVEWISQGYHGEMSYISRREPAYRNPELVLDGARSVVALAMNYFAPDLRTDSVVSGTASSSPASGAGQVEIPARVARYAQGQRDYHDLIRERLREIVAQIGQMAPGSHARGVVDTAPVLERDFARSAGLGWFGKNTMLINKKLGSWFFLAAVLVDIELDYDSPHSTRHCGVCTACLDSCPTSAFVAPYVLDARRCISYQTIELRGPIDRDSRTGIQNWLFGCDICQEVCPWNRKSPAATDPAFAPRPDLTPADPLALLSIGDAEFNHRFGRTPLARPGSSGLRRNAAIVVGNSGDQAAIPKLAALVNDPDAVVRGAVAWALGELGGEVALRVLRAWSEHEVDAAVRAEITTALAHAE